MSFNLDYKLLRRSKKLESNQDLISLPKTPIHSSEIQFGREAVYHSTLALTSGILLIVAFLLVAVIYTFYVVPRQEGNNIQAAVAKAVGPVGGFAYDRSVYTGVDLAARSAIVYDLTTNEVLYAHNADDQQPLASLTKLMTAVVAAELMEEGEEVVITDSAIAAEGDSGLTSQETWRFSELLDFTLLTSSNDGAQAIAAAAGAKIAGNNTSDSDGSLSRLAFVQRMNEKARDIGLTQTYFVNASGLDVGEMSSGSYGSARDIALLLDYMTQEHNELTQATRIRDKQFISLSGIQHTAYNTNQRIGNIPALITSKTGFTDLAGGNLALVYDAGIAHPVGIVVLGSSFEERFTDAEQLMHATQNYFSGSSVELTTN